MFYLYLPHGNLEEVVGSLQNVQSLAIQLSNGDIYLKISYIYKLSSGQKQRKKEAGIDIGINNLAAIFVNDKTTKSMVISGASLKHYNSCFNRLLAKLKNNGQCQMRKSSKQNFIQIPLLKLVDYLEYKAPDYGIRLHLVDERYTSKTSSLSANIIKVQEKAYHNKPVLTNDLKGNRVKRGLFRDKILGHFINADVNAALNIVKIGIGKNICWVKNYLFKLCNPLTFKSDRDLVCFLQANTDSDKTSLRRCNVVSS